MDFQKTIEKETKTSAGINPFTKEEIVIYFYPMPENSGLIFRVNGEDIKVNIDNAELLKTAIFLRGEEKSVGLIEHFLPPIFIFGLDNLLVEVNFKEEPFAFPSFENISAEVFNCLKNAGIKTQNAEKKYLTVDKEYSFKHENPEKNDEIKISPADKFIINYRVFFPHKAVGEQIYEFEVNEYNFCSEIMEARSPAFIKNQHEQYKNSVDKKFNLIIGGIDEPDYPNKDAKYGGQEFVRHKVLDFLGTLALFGKQFKNIRFDVNMSGHEFDLKVLKEMKNNFIEI